MPTGLIDVQDATFETQVLKSEKPVLLDFWAPWCGPCRAIGPVLEELAAQYGDRMTFAKCNIDDNQTTAETYKIKMIPSLLFFKNGEVLQQITGVTDRSTLEMAIRKITSAE